MKITIYSTTTCPYCKMLKDYLDNKNIAYEEKLVDQDEAARQEMMALSGGYLGVPYIVVDKDGGQEKIIGFDRGRLDSVLGIK